MASKKVPKDFWERMFRYPSFDSRFAFIISVVGIFFLTLTYILLIRSPIVDNISDQIALLNLILQGAMLLFGIFAAYYALRQLVETRFNSLEEAGMQELKRKHYSRAYQKWSEAFYIRPEVPVFANLSEALLLLGDFETFDEYMRMSERTEFLKKQLFQEESDQMILLYLKSMRQLLVRNQGAAEIHLAALVALVTEHSLSSLQWDFLDIQTSRLYQDLSGECRNMADNLISYMSKTMNPVRIVEFEAGRFSSQSEEEVLNSQLPVEI